MIPSIISDELSDFVDLRYPLGIRLSMRNLCYVRLVITRSNIFWK